MENGKSRAPAACRLPPASWRLTPAVSSSSLRSVVDRASLNHILLVVINAVAVHVDANFDLVLLAIANIARIKRQTILAAQQAVNRIKYVGNLAFESVGKISSARLFCESLECVVSLNQSHPSGHAGKPSVAGSESPYFLLEEIAGADDVDRDAGVLRYLAGIAVVYFAKRIQSRGH